MPATEFDSHRFSANPDREYRRRRQDSDELLKWSVPPREGLTGRCIIRKADGAMKLFALTTGETWDDHDFELSVFFDQLLGEAAA